MSAYIVSDNNVKLVAIASLMDWTKAVPTLPSAADVQEKAREFLKENYVSWNFRYSEPDTEDDRDIAMLTVTNQEVEELAHKYSVIAMHKIIQCYVYQSCEHPSWPDSHIRAKVEATLLKMSTKIPAYDKMKSSMEYNNAPWGIE